MITVHVGLHKTGSTAVQSFLSHPKRASAQGIVYLASFGLCSQSGFHSPTSPKAKQRQLLRLANSNRDVVLSSESFLGDVRNIYRDAPVRAQQLASFLHEMDEWQIVLYLRPQIFWIESVCKQLVQQGDTLEQDQFIRHAIGSRYIAWTRLVSDLVDVVSGTRLIVRPYSSNTDTIDDFLGILGGQISDTIGTSSGSSLMNVSISPTDYVLLKNTNPLLSRRAQVAARDLFQTSSHNIAWQGLSVLPRSVQEHFIELSLRDWRDLRAVVAGTHRADTVGFLQTCSTISAMNVRPSVWEAETTSITQEAVISTVSLLLEHYATTKHYRSRRWKKLGRKILRRMWRELFAHLRIMLARIT